MRIASRGSEGIELVTRSNGESSVANGTGGNLDQPSLSPLKYRACPKCLVVITWRDQMEYFEHVGECEGDRTDEANERQEEGE